MNRSTVALLVLLVGAVAAGAFVAVDRIQARKKHALRAAWTGLDRCLLRGPLEPGETPRARYDRVAFDHWLHQESDASAVAWPGPCPFELVRSAAEGAGEHDLVTALDARGPFGNVAGPWADALFREAARIGLPLGTGEADRTLASRPPLRGSFPSTPEGAAAGPIARARARLAGLPPARPDPMPLRGAAFTSKTFSITGQSWNEDPAVVLSATIDRPGSPKKPVSFDVTGHVERFCDGPSIAAFVLRSRRVHYLGGLLAGGDHSMLYLTTGTAWLLVPDTDWAYSRLVDPSPPNLFVSCDRNVLRFATAKQAGENSFDLAMSTCDDRRCELTHHRVTIPKMHAKERPRVVVADDDLVVAWREREIGLVVRRAPLARFLSGATTASDDVVVVREDPELVRDFESTAPETVALFPRHDRVAIVFSRGEARAMTVDRAGRVEPLDFRELGL